MVGLMGLVRVLSALAGGTSRVSQIESLDTTPLPEIFPVCETPRRGSDNAVRPHGLKGSLIFHYHSSRWTIWLLLYFIFLVAWPCRRERTCAIGFHMLFWARLYLGDSPPFEWDTELLLALHISPIKFTSSLRSPLKSSTREGVEF
jgi:hypothetical protein